jgi:hypothetical protein
MLEPLLQQLGQAYDASKLVPANRMLSTEGRAYDLHPLGAESFHNYLPLEAVREDFRVLAVDGGSISLFDTPYWGIGLVKLKARLIEFSLGRKEAKTVRAESRDKFVLFLSDEDDARAAKSDDVVSRKFYEKNNYLKREETRFTRDVLRQHWLEPQDLLLVDGALAMQKFYERELVKAHENIVGVSKRSDMRINKYSATAFLSLQAMAHKRNALPWFVFPFVARYPAEDPVAEIVFASFTPDSRYAFRVDFPVEKLAKLGDKEKRGHIAAQLSKIALFSLDPKYRGYPYPLGAVHTDSVMRPIDKDRARKFVEQKVTELQLPEEAKELIRKDIENEYWYDKFRQRAH